MQHDQFVEVLDKFPVGRYSVNSCQLRDILSHDGCLGVAVRVLHLGTFQLEQGDMLKRLKTDQHPRLDKVKITCLDGIVIIDEPSHRA